MPASLMRIRHATACATAIFQRRGHVISISAHAETNQFRINLRTTLFRMFVFFQHDDACAFTQNETVAILVPRTRSRRRIIVARGQCACRSKTAQTQRRNTCFCTTRQHHVGIAVLNHARRQTDAVNTRRACRDDRKIGTFQAKLDRQVAGNHVDDRRWHKEGADATRATIHVFSCAPCSIVGKPPMPELILTPIRSAFSSVTVRPLS